MTTETAVTTTEERPGISAAIMESVIVGGDLAKLSPADRVRYYRRVCESLGLNPLTQPFAYIVLNNKLTLYAKKDTCDQLRRIYDVSIIDIEERAEDGIYRVKTKAQMPSGRTDADIGAVPIVNLKGDALANAMKKAVTQSKRRVTLSICGLGWLDETEVDQIADARPVRYNPDTGEVTPITAAEPEPPKSLAEKVAEKAAAVAEDREDAAVLNAAAEQYKSKDWNAEFQPLPVEVSEALPGEEAEDMSHVPPDVQAMAAQISELAHPKAQAATTTAKQTTSTTDTEATPTASPSGESEQCDSYSKMTGDRCRLSTEPHIVHRTANESWPEKDGQRA